MHSVTTFSKQKNKVRLFSCTFECCLVDKIQMSVPNIASIINQQPELVSPIHSEEGSDAIIKQAYCVKVCIINDYIYIHIYISNINLNQTHNIFTIINSVHQCKYYVKDIVPNVTSLSLQNGTIQYYYIYFPLSAIQKKNEIQI